MGFLIAFLSMVIVFALLLPIIGAMYLDILEAKKETKRQQEQVQRMINQVKKEKENEWGKNTSNGNQKRFGWKNNICFITFIVFMRCLPYVGAV